jgi:hypothetical protein
MAQRFAKVTLYGEPEKVFQPQRTDVKREIILDLEKHEYSDAQTGQVLESVGSFLARKGLTTIPPDLPAVRQAAERGRKIHEEIAYMVSKFKKYTGKKDGYGVGLSKEEIQKEYEKDIDTLTYKKEVRSFMDYLQCDMLDNSHWNHVKSEKILWKWQLAGTADLIFEDRCGRMTLLDVKTGKKPNLDHVCWQLMFYAYLMDWQLCYPPERITMAHITPEGETDIVNFKVSMDCNRSGWNVVNRYFRELHRDKGDIYIKVTE